MAKKQSDKPEEAPEKDKAAPAEGASPADASAKKPREPKPKKTAPDASGAASTATPPAAGEAPTPKPAAAPSAPGESTKKKGKQPGVPPRRGKKLRNQLKSFDDKLAKEGVVPLKKGITLLKQARHAKFDETVEIHMWLGIDTAQSDQMIRGAVPLPHGVGKTVRVVVFCQGENVAKAKEAGAMMAGSDELIKKIQGEGWLDFDVALATQDMMGQVSRLGKVLGPRGLMPTPKAGTVIPTTGDIAAAVGEFKAGKVEFRADKGGNVHAGVGKMSFDEEKLVANVTAFVEQVRAAKPASVKAHYIRSITLSSTMGPGIAISV